MSQVVDNLKAWFNKLSDAEKREVVEFLYGNPPMDKAVGSRTGSHKEARGYKLYLGPAPSGGYCSQCGAPL